MGAWHTGVVNRSKLSHDTFVIFNSRKLLQTMLALPIAGAGRRAERVGADGRAVAGGARGADHRPRGAAAAARRATATEPMRSRLRDGARGRSARGAQALEHDDQPVELQRHRILTQRQHGGPCGRAAASTRPTAGSGRSRCRARSACRRRRARAAGATKRASSASTLSPWRDRDLARAAGVAGRARRAARGLGRRASARRCAQPPALDSACRGALEQAEQAPRLGAREDAGDDEQHGPAERERDVDPRCCESGTTRAAPAQQRSSRRRAPTQPSSRHASTSSGSSPRCERQSMYSEPGQRRDQRGVRGAADAVGAGRARGRRSERHQERDHRDAAERRDLPREPGHPVGDR